MVGKEKKTQELHFATCETDNEIPVSAPINKVLLGPSHALCLYTVYGSFCVRAEFSSCDRN